MSIKTLTRSFAGGEITPELFGRIDLGKFQTGLSVCRNFIPLPHGPVARRPGTKYVNEVKTSANYTRLIPFAFSADQTMVLEFGNQYLRFHTLGGTLVSAASLNIAGTSIYDGSDLSTTSADVTYYLDPTSSIVNIDGQVVGRTTVETVNNPKR